MSRKTRAVKDDEEDKVDNVTKSKGEGEGKCVPGKSRKTRAKDDDEDSVKGGEWKHVIGKGEKIKGCTGDGGDHPKSICHKIPISSDLYLETHTHVRPSLRSTKPKTPAGDGKVLRKSSSFIAPCREREPERDPDRDLQLRLENLELRNEAAGTVKL